MGLWCAPEHSSASSRMYAGRVVLVVLPTCAKIAPVDDLNIAIAELSRIAGMNPGQTTRVGRWTVLEWPQLESTNSMALRALKSVPAKSLDHLAITTHLQTAGRGQQQRIWSQSHDADLALTLVLESHLPAALPFSLNLAVSLSVLQAIEATLPKLRGSDLEIKWPNDIMWKGRKAGGILIENNWRGNAWASTVIGIGLNLCGTPPFPNATSLNLSGNDPNELAALRQQLIEAVATTLDSRLAELHHPDALLRQYHERLHGWGKPQRWQLDGTEVRGILESIDLDGRLCVNENGVSHCFSPGEVGWLGMEPNT